MLNLKNIIDNLPSAVIVVGTDRRVLLANKMAQAFSGEDESSLIGKRGGDAMGCAHAEESPDGCGYGKSCRFCEVKNAVVRAFQTKKDIEPFETAIETGQHGSLYLKITVTVLKNPLAGSPQTLESAAIVTVDDMTEYKKRERLEAVMETVGTICHDMNQPLMVLSGQLDMLAMDIGGNRRIDILNEQVARMSAITRKLHSIKRYATKPYLKNDFHIVDMEKACA